VVLVLYQRPYVLYAIDRDRTPKTVLKDTHLNEEHEKGMRKKTIEGVPTPLKRSESDYSDYSDK